MYNIMGVADMEALEWRASNFHDVGLAGPQDVFCSLCAG